MSFPTNLPNSSNDGKSITLALQAVYNAIVAGGSGGATEATLLQVQSEVENAVQELIDLNTKNIQSAKSSAGWLEDIWKNTKDWDNTGLTTAQLLNALYNRIVLVCTGQGGSAVSYSGSEATLALASVALAKQINSRKANQAIVFVVSSGILFQGGNYEWFVTIIG